MDSNFAICLDLPRIEGLQTSKQDFAFFPIPLFDQFTVDELGLATTAALTSM